MKTNIQIVDAIMKKVQDRDQAWRAINAVFGYLDGYVTREEAVELAGEEIMKEVDGGETL